MKKKKAVDESPAAILGSKGGQATMKKYGGSEYAKKLAKLAVAKRKANHEKRTKAR